MTAASFFAWARIHVVFQMNIFKMYITIRTLCMKGYSTVLFSFLKFKLHVFLLLKHEIVAQTYDDNFSLSESVFRPWTRKKYKPFFDNTLIVDIYHDQFAQSFCPKWLTLSETYLQVVRNKIESRRYFDLGIFNGDTYLPLKIN